MVKVRFIRQRRQKRRDWQAALSIGSTIGKLLGGLFLAFAVGSGSGYGAEGSPADVPLRPSVACPTDLEALMAALLRDLPSYTNLVATRSRATLAETGAPFGLVVLVSEPEYEPIDLTSRTFRDLPGAESATTQVFFTTLERQYFGDESFLLQHYHWLFLAPSDQGWQMVLMYSSVGPYPAIGRPPSPPQDSTDGIVGRAVYLWLRDCRARSVYPPERTVEPVPAETQPVEPLPLEPAPSAPATGETEPF